MAKTDRFPFWFAGGLAVSVALNLLGEGAAHSLGVLGTMFFSFVAAVVFWSFVIGYALYRVGADDDAVVALSCFLGGVYLAYLSLSFAERLVEQ